MLLRPALALLSAGLGSCGTPNSGGGGARVCSLRLAACGLRRRPGLAQARLAVQVMGLWGCLHVRSICDTRSVGVVHGLARAAYKSGATQSGGVRVLLRTLGCWARSAAAHVGRGGRLSNKRNDRQAVCY